MNLKTLQKNAARLEELRATHVELEGMVSSLTEEANRLASSLENIDPRILLQVQPERKHLPDKDVEKLQRLNALKEKISLVPGARVNVERKAAALAGLYKIMRGKGGPEAVESAWADDAGCMT